jgi:uncharacterized phiE125 gp8 family phage protein
VGLNLVTAPTSDPISLAEAKAHCRVTTLDEDGLIAGYILAAREMAETYTRRAFTTQTWDFTIDCDWPQAVDREVYRTQDRIVLPKPPVQSVTSVSYTDLDGNEQTLATNQYRVLRLNQERSEAFIDPAYGVVWPSVRRQAETIRVRFVCGYSAENPLPESIRHAMLLIIAHFYEHREAVNVGNIVNELPMGVEALLFPYRVFY